MIEYKNFSLEELLKHTYDSAAWYWLGMAYWERRDFINAAVWLEKTMNDHGNEWAGKATLNLGLAHAGKFLPNSSRDEALRLFEKILAQNPNAAMTKLNAGFLYYEGTETKHNPAKGKEFIEAAISLLIKNNGNDSYLSQGECYKIGAMYGQEAINSKAIEYFKKAIDRANSNYESDRSLIKNAKSIIRQLGG